MIRKLMFYVFCTITFILLIGVSDSYALEKTDPQNYPSHDILNSRTKIHNNLKIDTLKKNNQKMSSDLAQLLDNEGTSAQDSIKLREEVADFGQLIHKGQYNNLEANNSPGDLVHVYIQIYPDSDMNPIKLLVNRIENMDESIHLIAAWVGINQLDALSDLPCIKSVRTVSPPIFNAKSEGDELLLASKFRQYEGVDGSGIKVGVISDGVDHWLDAKKTGDLPENLHVLSNNYGGDEGTAMLEIIQDLAPGAELYFHDCGNNELAFNAAVDELINAGCNVICDDVCWPDQPYFEDGIVAQHVALAIASHNIVYISAAGDCADNHYQAVFWDYYNGWHDFSQGQSDDKSLNMSIPPGGQVIVFLQWDDQFGCSDSDYDLYLSDGSGALLGYSNNIQSGSEDPIESIVYTNDSDRDKYGYIDVHKENGYNKTLELYIFPSNGASIYNYNITPKDSIFGHAAVPDVISVGASKNYGDAYGFEVADYSSRGPVTISFPSPKIRKKPDICGLESVYVSCASNIYGRFSGTSAAAPHVAAIAALVWSNAPGQTAAQVRNALITGANNPWVNYSYDYGYGMVNAMGTIQTPELLIINMDVSKKIYTSSFQETERIMNIGTVCNKPFIIGYYLSRDDIFDASDLCIKQKEVNTEIPARQEYCPEETTDLTIPATVPNGIYYLFMLVDSLNNLNEINRNNNLKRFGPITILISGIDPLPSIFAISPAEGQESGGVIVTLTGANLDTASEVYFGNNPASSFHYSNNQLIVVAPAGMGIVHVTAVNQYGRSLNSANDLYTYVPMTKNRGIISTFAGNGVSGYSGDGEPAVSAKLAYPVELAFDGNDNMYIADCKNHRIRKVDLSGQISTIAGTGSSGFSGDGGAATLAELNHPNGITFDNMGFLYIADCWNNCIRKVDSFGKISTAAGAGFYICDALATSAFITFPSRIAFDSVGNMYISSNHCIYKANTTGEISIYAGNGTFGNDAPPAVSVGLCYPKGITFDHTGNMYIADSANHCIHRIDNFGKIKTFAGNGTAGYSGDGGPATLATLDQPSDMTFDRSGNMYIADSGNNCIRKIATSGIITTVVGTGSNGYSGDGGDAALAQLNYPTAVAVDSNDNLYIADYSNSCIRKVVFNRLQNSAISPTTARLNKNTTYQTDVPVILDLKGNVLISITNNGISLNAGTDYSIAENICTLFSTYLARQPVGITTIRFNFDGGDPAQISLKISDTPYQELPFAEVLANRINQNQHFNQYFNVSASDDAVILNIVADEANLEESFDILSLTALLFNMENELNCTVDSIILTPGISYSLSDLINKPTDTYLAIKQAVIDLIDPTATSYDQLKLGQLAGKNIQIRLASGQVITLQFQHIDECFIATAAFGSKFTWPVTLLRHFRDQFLLTTSWGRGFVRFYYDNSPPIASAIASSQALKLLVRALLAPAILIIYSIYHPIILLLLILLVFVLTRRSYLFSI